MTGARFRQPTQVRTGIDVSATGNSSARPVRDVPRGVAQAAALPRSGAGDALRPVVLRLDGGGLEVARAVAAGGELGVGDAAEQRRQAVVHPRLPIGRQGAGLRETFKIRKISFGVGVERTYPIHSPIIDKIEVVTRGDVRRAKLYYLRDLRGKAAKIKEKRESVPAGKSKSRAPSGSTAAADSNAAAASSSASE